MLQQISRGIGAVIDRVLLVVGAAICTILFAQVLARHLGASLGWSEEVSRHLLVAITFLGGTSAYKRAGFIGLKGIGQALGPGRQRLIVLGLHLLTLACFSLIAWFGTLYTIKAWEHTSAALQLPMAIPFAVIPLAAAILVVHAAANISQVIERRSP